MSNSYVFYRYRQGVRMPESIAIHDAKTLEEATVKASRLLSGMNVMAGDTFQYAENAASHEEMAKAETGDAGVPGRTYKFDRYRDGTKMAQGIRIERADSLEQATAKASRILASSYPRTDVIALSTDPSDELREANRTAFIVRQRQVSAERKLSWAMDKLEKVEAERGSLLKLNKEWSECVEANLNLTNEAIQERDQALQRFNALAKEIRGIMQDSDGVAGYHCNGSIADWDEFQLGSLIGDGDGKKAEAKREAGWYWVQFEEDAEWEVAEFDGDGWLLAGNETRWHETALFSIGDRVSCPYKWVG